MQGLLQITKGNITILRIVLSNFQIWVVCQKTAAVATKSNNTEVQT